MGVLRTVLAISVILAHSPWRSGTLLLGGQFAVQLFYIISGFLICHVICSNKTYRSPWRFYQSRFLRLYPMYYVVAIVSLITMAVVRPDFFKAYNGAPTAAVVLLVLSNLLIFGQDWVLFSGVERGALVFDSNFHKADIPLQEGLLVPQAWTLGVELSFYLIAPFILRRKETIVVLLLLSILVRVVLISHDVGLHDPWTYRFFPAELALFMIGALSNRMMLPAWTDFMAQNTRKWLPASATYGLLLYVMLFGFMPVHPIIKTGFLFVIFPLMLPLTFIHQNKTPLDKAIGELSYPLYICHIFAIVTVTYVCKMFRIADPFWVTVSSLVFSFVVAMLLKRYVGDLVEATRAKIKGAPSQQTLATA